jgi:ABC-type glycerol-3-phosphate transport system substrate-binding protein
MPANSVRKDEAWQFIAWVESPEIVRERALRGHAPTRLDIFRDPEVLARFPHYAAIEDMVARAKKVPIFRYTAMMGDVIGREVSLAAIGEKSVEQALADAERGLQDLLRRAGLGR